MHKLLSYDSVVQHQLSEKVRAKDGQDFLSACFGFLISLPFFIAPLCVLFLIAIGIRAALINFIALF